MRAVLLILAILLVGGWVGIRHLPDDALADPVAQDIRPQEVRSVALDGQRGLPLAELRHVLETRAGALIDLATVQRDRQAMTSVLVGRGYLTARVDEPRVTFGGDGAVYVTFPITQGPLFRIRAVTVEGASANEVGVVTIGTGEVADADRIALARRAVETRLHVRGKQSTLEAALTVDTAAAVVDLKLTAH